MNIKRMIPALGMLVMAFASAQTPPNASGDQKTLFTNQGTIANTRHNMTQQPPAGGNFNALMEPFRNNYGEVCVYCHTPHGANTGVALPLWNRTIKATTYTTYNQLGTSTLTQEVAQPGANSLACLSCHDGQTAVDSIINMPGSGRYEKSLETGAGLDRAAIDALLNKWEKPSSSHMAMTVPGAAGGGATCLTCHGTEGTIGTNFNVFAIGTDLKNDHPVGVTYPSTSGVSADFKTPLGKKGANFFFDKDTNGHMDGNDIRLYDNGGTAKVECASCHDPHGVPSAGAGSIFNPTFLRVQNTGSAVCLTCHAK
jgi:hypothetical protein